jgi:threonine/homoserine/homoserine lactone efflux protein
MLPPILHGAFLGLSIAAPFGPVSLLCLQRSLMGRPYLGLISGIGAATAHGAFASMAVGGADVIADALSAWKTPVHLVSAGVLMLLGVRLLLKKAARKTDPPAEAPHAAYLSGLMLGLSNPMTILPYLATASTIATDAAGRSDNALLMVPGAIVGAAFWYSVVCSGALLLRRGLAGAITQHLNLGAGVAVMGFGVIIGLG